MNLLIIGGLFIFGAIIGSFLNVLILRLRSDESPVTGRSHCPACNHVLSPLELIPLLSFVLLGGKCRHCWAEISWQYPLVELATGLLFVVSWVLGGYDLLGLINRPLGLIELVRNFILIGGLVTLFVYDFRWQELPYIITFPLLGIIFLLNLAVGEPWWSLVLAGLVGGGFFLFQFLISKGKWIGDGDIPLGALIGVAVGWPLVIVALLISYWVGAVIAIGLVLSGGKKMTSTVPLGVFLVIGTLITTWWGDALINWYFSIL